MKLYLPTALRGALAACLACATGITMADQTYSDNGNDSMLSGVATDTTVIFKTTPGTTDDTYNKFYDAHIVHEGAIQILDDASTESVTEGLHIVNSPQKTVWFKGDLTGDGAITMSSASNQTHLLFTGDASAYTGNITLSDAGANVYLEFGGQSTMTDNGGYTDARGAYGSDTSTSTNGVSGTGNITLSSDKARLTYRYNAKEDGSPTYVTNKITGNGIVILSGTADMTFTKSFTTGTLYFLDDAKTSDLTVTLKGTDANSTINATNGAGKATLVVDNGASGSSFVILTKDALFKNIEVKSGKLALNTASSGTYAQGDITIKQGALLQAGSAAGSLTLTNTITALGNNETPLATYTAKEGGATYSNYYIKNNTLEAISYTSDGHATPGIANADIKIYGDYNIKAMNLGSSSVVVNSDVTLTAINSNTETDTTLGELTVMKNAKLTKSGTGNFIYTGSISLTLGSDTASYDSDTAALTATALTGTMSTGSSLALNIAGVDDDLDLLAANSTITLTLSNLVMNSGFTLSADNLTVTGWNVNYKTINYGASATTLSLTKAVPEPTTATLSLLALAGLAARRRRK